MTAYYNEFDPKAAAWLRELIKQGHIALGDVDERSIEDVRPDDLKGYTQCHFFAGIGVWSYALRRAGWGDDRPVWTGSCPCQPFSAAGKGKGFADERHLWPSFFHLIKAQRPRVVFGEQVASKDGLAWLDLVQDDLEGENYSLGPVDTCASGFGAPHIRQRLYWVANANDARLEGRSGPVGCQLGENRQVIALRDALGLAYAHGTGRIARGVTSSSTRYGCSFGAEGGDDCNRSTSPTNGFWGNPDWLFCRGGKWRPVEPSTFPLAHGAPARVGRLRGYGNALNAEQAKGFIEAYMDLELVL